MQPRPPAERPVPQNPDIDENGVDRAQIRAMLALTPEQRLRWVEEFMDSVAEIRKASEPPALR